MRLMKYIGEDIYIRPLQLSDAEAKLKLELDNREFFQAYSPIHEESFYTLEVQRQLIEEGENKWKEDSRYSFGIFLKETDELIGHISLSHIARGPVQSCLLGYSLDQQQNGKGYMTEAVKLAVDFAFRELKFHRIEAGVMPRNKGSLRVLEKAGFHKEGIAVENVMINGKWEDHQMMAIIAKD